MKTREQTLEFLLEDRIKLATVSGIATTKPALLEWFDEYVLAVEFLTSKSYQVRPNRGNREAIIVEDSVGNFGNAVGLRNPGMEQGYRDLVALRKRRDLRCYLNVSLSANSIDDFILLVKRFEDIADILELNFSCPNIVRDSSEIIGCNVDIVKEYVKELRKVTDALLFPKLTPIAENIGEIAVAAMDAEADGLVLSNTFDPMVYREPYTGKSILYNPKGHKGGKSGEWIKEQSLAKVKEVRGAIGGCPPIIGMGGITTGEDIRRMRDAGANVIGLGSVFARVHPKERPDYAAAVKKDAEKGTKEAALFVSDERLAEYKPHKITKITEKEKDLKVFELEGRIGYDASQFAFLWVPEVGEKPFSIARNDPLTFIIRKREHDPKKEEGLVSHALFQLKKGDELMIRSVYGADAPDSQKPDAYIVAGGTGIAVVPKLAEKLHKQGKKVTVYYGITSENQIVLEESINQYARYIPVADEGVKGRVVDVMQQDIKEENSSSACFYNIGPVPLMEKAMNAQKHMGADSKDIFASIETNNMCGIGVCGECECGGKLTCKEGTFFSIDYLNSKGIDIKDFEK